MKILECDELHLTALIKKTYFNYSFFLKSRRPNDYQLWHVVVEWPLTLHFEMAPKTALSKPSRILRGERSFFVLREWIRRLTHKTVTSSCPSYVDTHFNVLRHPRLQLPLTTDWPYHRSQFSPLLSPNWGHYFVLFVLQHYS